MNRFRGKLWHYLRASWVYIFMAVVVAGSSTAVLTAGGSIEAVDTCQELIPACERVEDLEQTQRQTFDQADTLARINPGSIVSYRIVFEGDLEASTDTDEFIVQVAQTLADNQGWNRAGYQFNRVQSPNQSGFSLTLIQAELLDDVPGCSSQWSCRAGSNVYINEDRWNHATNAWNNAGGGLRDYRHMVVNHEVGHWLGHGHYNCSDSPNNLAPVMQQQSIDLQGCMFNPWPLQFEIDAV